MPVFAASTAQTPAVRSVVRADVKSGKLLRVVAAPAPTPVSSSASAVRESLDPVIERIAREQGVESQLVHSVIQTESNYTPQAVSPKGAQGIMQLIPSTAKRFGVANSFDAEDNIQGGVKYLRFLLDYYHGDYARTIAAYNAGEKAVDRYDGVPPYRETQNYVNHVAKALKAEREKPAAIEVVADAGPVAETEKRIEASVGSDGLVYYRTP